MAKAAKQYDVSRNQHFGKPAFPDSISWLTTETASDLYSLFLAPEEPKKKCVVCSGFQVSACEREG
jgi:hypothetical protein